jgi:hypothetical protein
MGARRPPSANVVVSNGTLSGIVDFGAGDPAWDLAAAWVLRRRGAAERPHGRTVGVVSVVSLRSHPQAVRQPKAKSGPVP